MATTVSLTNITKEAGGRVLVDFADSVQLEFNSLEQCLAYARKPDADRDLTRQMCLAWIAARSPDLSNIAPIRDKDFIFDLSAPAPIKVQ